MRFLAYLAFTGSPYIGFQLQTKFYNPSKTFKSIQETVEKVLEEYFEQRIRIQSASRTDGGVNAQNFPIQFDVKEMDKFKNLNYDKFSSSIIQKALNHKLKWQREEIYIHNIEQVDDVFSISQFCKSKTYIYNIVHNMGQHNTCHLIKDSWNISHLLDAEKLRVLAEPFVGYSNFHFFTDETLDDKQQFKRKLINFQIEEQQHKFVKGAKQIALTLQGVGFLRYQIRFLIGSMVNVHLDEKKCQEFLSTRSKENEILLRSQFKWRVRAPSHGLTFSHIN